MESQNIKEQIFELSKELSFPTLRLQYDYIMEQARENNYSYQELLKEFLIQEYDYKRNRRLNNRIKTAGFPQRKYIEDLIKEELPDQGREKLNVLSSLNFIKTGQNIILSGNPGTGKTHIAIGLGVKACLEDFKVMFTTVPKLITQLKESRTERTLRMFENRFEKYDLVICDEFGYVSFDKQGAELLFTLLSLRAGKKSMIITTNLSFERWSEIFGDKVLTAAMVDRLTHKAIMVNMNGNSYRIKETQKMYADAN